MNNQQKPIVYCMAACLTLFAWMVLRHQQFRSVFVQDDNTFLAGVAFYGAPLTHRFVLVNPNAASVQVETAAADCGCSIGPSVKLAANAIPPHGTLAANVETTATGEGTRTQSVKLALRCGSHTQDIWLFVKYTVAPKTQDLANRTETTP